MGAWRTERAVRAGPLETARMAGGERNCPVWVFFSKSKPNGPTRHHFSTRGSFNRGRWDSRLPPMGQLLSFLNGGKESLNIWVDLERAPPAIRC